jgi:hypothetical protein
MLMMSGGRYMKRCVSFYKAALVGSGVFGVLCLLLFFWMLPVSAQVQVTSLDSSGELAWSNAVSQAQQFEVQWASSPTSEWSASWSDLTAIPATGTAYRVPVPMCYRVVAQTNVLQSRWTLLYYLDGDNDLEPDFVTKFRELNQWNSDTNVQIVVQFARLGNDTSFGGWHRSERFYVTNGIVPSADQAVQDWGDGTGGRLLNMADPQNLVDFIDWAALNYPADHYALLVGDHGFGWPGMCICWSYAKSTLYLSDLRQALEDASVTVEVLFLDACLMSMADVLNELRYTDLQYAMLSETYGQCDWPYGWMLEGLQGNPLWTARQFAEDVNDRLGDYYTVSNVVDKISLCTADMSQVPLLVSNTALFASGILDTNVPFSTVQARAQSVMDRITNTLFVRYLGSDWDDIAFGLSVYFPLKDGLHVRQSFDDYTGRRTRFSMEGNWRVLLETFYDPMSHDPYHSELNAARAAITNYLDYSGQGYGNEYIDLYDFCRKIVESSP